MSSLDIKKFKKILQKYDITILEYYCIDKKCALIKAFINPLCEFLLIYIPTKIRFEISGQNVFDATELEEDKSDPDDYSNTSKVPNIGSIDEEKSVSKYQELTKKYKTNISLENSDEPVQRKINRQLSRLKLPFSKLQYDIAIQNTKYIGVSFGDSNSIFLIKNYSKLKTPIYNIMYVINVNDLIDKLEDLVQDIDTIKTQFYSIIKNVSNSNFNSISQENKSYDNIFLGIISKKDDYQKSIAEYKELYNKIKEREDSIIENYQNMIKSSTDNIKKVSLENKFQKEMNDLFFSKNDIIKKGTILVSKYQKNLLILEEVSFDNSIMIERINKNFNLLKDL